MDGRDAHEVVQRLDRGGFKYAQELAYALILGCLEKICEALLAGTLIPYRDPICHDWDHEGVIDLSPLEHVDPSDRISENVDATDGGAAPVCHDLGMVSPVEFGVNVDPEISNGFFGNFHGLGPKDWVGVS
jgi:hypothetical protein